MSEARDSPDFIASQEDLESPAVSGQPAEALPLQAEARASNGEHDSGINM